VFPPYPGSTLDFSFSCSIFPYISSRGATPRQILVQQQLTSPPPRPDLLDSPDPACGGTAVRTTKRSPAAGTKLDRSRKQTRNRNPSQQAPLLPTRQHTVLIGRLLLPYRPNNKPHTHPSDNNPAAPPSAGAAADCFVHHPLRQIPARSSAAAASDRTKTHPASLSLLQPPAPSHLRLLSPLPGLRRTRSVCYPMAGRLRASPHASHASLTSPSPP
jgi:hypothetical protein